MSTIATAQVGNQDKVASAHTQNNSRQSEQENSPTKATYNTAEAFCVKDENGSPKRDEFTRRVYNPLRESMHKQIVEQLLYAGEVSDSPTILFTAGLFGVGKGTAVKSLIEEGIIDGDKFIWVDPDQIKRLIPEYERFKKIDPEQAATLVHEESGHIQELLVEEALKQGKNILIDGSLYAKDWWDGEMTRIKSTYETYNIAIVYVDGNLETAIKRANERSEDPSSDDFGRKPPEGLMRALAPQIEDSVPYLAKKHASSFIIIESRDDGFVIRNTNGEGEGNEIVAGSRTLRSPIHDRKLARLLPGLRDGETITTFSARPVTSVEELEQVASKSEYTLDNNTVTNPARPVVFVDGLVETDYQFPAAVRERLAKLVAEQGDNVVYAIPSGRNGIARAAEWIRGFAHSNGFRNVEVCSLQPSETNRAPDAPLNQSQKAEVRTLLNTALTASFEIDSTVWCFGGDFDTEQTIVRSLEDSSKVSRVLVYNNPRFQMDPILKELRLVGDVSAICDVRDELLQEHSKNKKLKILTSVSAGQENELLELHKKLFKFEEMTHDQVVEFMLMNYPEIALLADGSVRASVDAIAESRNNTKTEQDRVAHNTVAAVRVNQLTREMVYPPENETNGPPGSGNLLRPAFTQNFSEVKRTLQSAVVCAAVLAHPERYDEIVQCQPSVAGTTENETSGNIKEQLSEADPRLTLKTAESLATIVRQVLKDPETLQTMLTSIALTNIGKSQSLVKFLRESDPDIKDLTFKNHQHVIYTALTKYPSLFPSFERLSDRQKKLVLDSFELDFNVNTVNQGSHTAENLKALGRFSKESYEFYVVSALLKLGGAKGHIERRGSETLTEPTVQNFLEVLQYLSPAVGNTNQTELLLADRALFTNRSQRLGIQDRDDLSTEQKIVVTKLCSRMRISDPSVAGVVADRFKNLSGDDKRLLETEIMRSGFSDEPAKRLSMIGALFTNVVRSYETVTEESVSWHMKLQADCYRAIAELARNEGLSQQNITASTHKLAEALMSKGIDSDIGWDKYKRGVASITATIEEDGSVHLGLKEPYVTL